jgi:uncharacterized protein (DUF736 family)
MAATDLVELTGLWQNTTKDGKKYLSGRIGNAKVLVFPNGFKKEGSNEPDYRLCLARIEPPGEDKKESKNGELPF